MQGRQRQRFSTNVRGEMECLSDFPGVNVVLDGEAANHDAQATTGGEDIHSEASRSGAEMRTMYTSLSVRR